MSDLTFKKFSETNRLRCETDFKHPLEDWSPAEWSNAMAGECGEACNFTKKLLRGDEDVEVEDIAKELADVVCYADLVAARLGIDLEEWVIRKFNEVSDRRGSKIKLPTEKYPVEKVEEISETEEDLGLSRCENCDEEAWDGYICHSCGAKNI
jgi:NTP pyrophosphatase (non-canonical NTP hydrolase)